MPSSDHGKRLRAELAAELGWYPADLDDESIARHHADAARKKTDRDPAKRWAHLTELARQRDVEAAGRSRGGPVRVTTGRSGACDPLRQQRHAGGLHRGRDARGFHLCRKR